MLLPAGPEIVGKNILFSFLPLLTSRYPGFHASHLLEKIICILQESLDLFFYNNGHKDKLMIFIMMWLLWTAPLRKFSNNTFNNPHLRYLLLEFPTFSIFVISSDNVGAQICSLISGIIYWKRLPSSYCGIYHRHNPSRISGIWRRMYKQFFSRKLIVESLKGW